MDQKTISVMNLMALMLLTPATIILAWKAISEKLKGKGSSAELMTGALILGSAFIGLAQLNIDRADWLGWSLAVVQLILLFFLFKRLWLPLKQKLYL